MRNPFKELRSNNPDSVYVVKEEDVPEDLREKRDEIKKHAEEGRISLQKWGDVEIKRTVQREPFVKYFLPYFAGLTELSEELKTNVQAKWLDVCGNIFMEVYVVNQKGETIAIVPAMKRNDVFFPKIGKSQRIDSALVGISNLTMARAGIYAQRQESILLESISNIVDQKANVGIEEQWQELFTFFKDDLLEYMDRKAGRQIPTTPQEKKDIVANEKPKNSYSVTDDPDVVWDDED